MPPDLHRAIASRGGRAAHRLGVAHEWTQAEAVAAGRKGGKARAAQRWDFIERRLAALDGEGGA